MSFIRVILPCLIFITVQDFICSIEVNLIHEGYIHKVLEPIIQLLSSQAVPGAQFSAFVLLDATDDDFQLIAQPGCPITDAQEVVVVGVNYAVARVNMTKNETVR